MRIRQTISVVLVAAAIGSLVMSGVTWKRRSTQLAGMRADAVQARADLDSVRSDLHTTGMRYRGFAESRLSVPDSVRRAAGGLIMAEDNAYRKKISELERDERNLKARVDKLEESQIGGRHARGMAVLPWIVAALLFLGLAKAVTRRAVAA
jgi:outer membrane murein-binding lipoprotein Lpp